MRRQCEHSVCPANPKASQTMCSITHSACQTRDVIQLRVGPSYRNRKNISRHEKDKWTFYKHCWWTFEIVRQCCRPNDTNTSNLHSQHNAPINTLTSSSHPHLSLKGGRFSGQTAVASYHRVTDQYTPIGWRKITVKWLKLQLCPSVPGSNPDPRHVIPGYSMVKP